MDTTFTVITITAMLMVLCNGSSEPPPSMNLFYRAGALWLRTVGSVLRPLQCHCSAIPHSLPMTQLSPSEYLVLVKHEGQYWCEDSSGVHSNIYHRKKLRKKRTVTAQWNSGEQEPTMADRWNTSHSDGQKPRGEPVSSKSADLTHSGALKLMTANKALLTEQNTTCPALAQKVENGAERYQPAVKLDVDLSRTAHDLQNIAQKDVISTMDLENATSMVDKALQMNHSVLSNAHQNVRSIVYWLDAVLTRVCLPPGISVMDVKPQVAIFVLNVELQPPPMAVVLKSSGNNGDLGESSLSTVNSEEELKSPNMDVAVLLPQSPTAQTSHISLAIFNDDRAFQNPPNKVNSRIVSITMVGAPQIQGEKYVEIRFKPLAETGEKKCVFWDFTLSGGAWSAEGCELVASVAGVHDVCRCSHLTHFAEIIMPPGTEMDPGHQKVLAIISTLGCSLSLVGVLGIFLTGAAFQQWRAQLGNKILLHLSAAVSLNMLVFLITGTGMLRSNTACIILGVLLHYSVLASFCWMLVSAGLQFMRLVTVFGSQHIPHLLLKASLFAWGAPLLPVTVLLSVDTKIYAPHTGGFCYPGGLAFYLALLSPVVMIVTANLTVFGMILQHIFRGSAIRRHMKSWRKLAMRQVATSVLLFFLLGLSWVFGLLAGFSTLWAYLFCITATLQGFVLFLFFLLGDKKTRHYWTKSSATRNPITTTVTPPERLALRQGDDTIHL